MRRVLASLPVQATLCIGVIVALIALGRSSDSRDHLASFAGGAGPFEIIVSMPFEPEAFHLSELQSAGRIASVEGTDVHLRAVRRDALQSLSWRPWVADLQMYSEGGDS